VKSLNVLITAASRRVPLVRAFQRALEAAGARGRVVVTDVNPLSPAVHVAERWYLVPMADDPLYLDALLAICDAEHIGLVIPTIDDELVLMGDARDAFNRRGAVVAVSAPETSRICNDKYETCRSLRERGVDAVPVWLPNELDESVAFPLFVKPRFGRGGVGAHAVRNARELAFFLDYVEQPVVQTYLSGPEFTIDVCCDLRSQVLSIVPRERVVIRAGVTDRGRTVRDPRLMTLAESVVNAMPFVGALNVQARMLDGVPMVFEINPRFSGGIPLTIAAGGDFPRLLVDVALGRRVAPRIGQFRDGVWMTNYEESVFLTAEQAAGTGREAALTIGDVA